MKRSNSIFTKWRVLSLSLVAGLALVGVTYASIVGIPVTSNIVSNLYFEDPFAWVVSNDDGVENSRSPYGVIDPGDNGMDPNQPQTRGVALPAGGRYGENVATATAWVEPDPDYITIMIGNAYPFYNPTFFFAMYVSGNLPAKIYSITIDESPGDDTLGPDIPALTVTVDGIAVGQTIEVGQEAIGRINVLINQIAEQNHTYRVRIDIVTVCLEFGGTPGYWQNWRSHYSVANMTSFLSAVYNDPINRSPGWVKTEIDANKNGTITIAEMEAILNAGIGKDATPKSKFLRQYMATRLDAVSGRLYWDNTHDVTGINGYQYLGLANPSSSTLEQIIAAIESKYPVTKKVNGWSIDKQYDILKNVCDALNNVQI